MFPWRLHRSTSQWNLYADTTYVWQKCIANWIREVSWVRYTEDPGYSNSSTRAYHAQVNHRQKLISIELPGYLLFSDRESKWCPSSRMESFLCCGCQVCRHELNIFACKKLLASTCFRIAFANFRARKVTRGCLDLLNLLAECSSTRRGQ